MSKNSKRESTELEQQAYDFFMESGDNSIYEYGTPEYRILNQQHDRRCSALMAVARSKNGITDSVDGLNIRRLAIETTSNDGYDYSYNCDVVIELSGVLNGILKFSDDPSSWQDGHLGEAFYDSKFTEVKPVTKEVIVYE